MTGMDIRPGDTVWLRAEVLRTSAVPDGLSSDAQVKVRLFGKVDQHELWVLVRDHVERVVPRGQGLPSEPADGTWIHVGRKAWRRDDAEGHNDQATNPDPDEWARRFDRCWWDFEYQEWVDWPTAYARGARPGSHPFRRADVEPD